MRPDHLIDQTTKIVVAYVSHNYIPSNEIRTLINSIHDALSKLEFTVDARCLSLEPKSLAQIAESQKYDWLISFIDDQPYKTLKRHLNAHGLTPDIYRARYGLPADYPMIAPAYAARRSQIARGLQLGYKRYE